MHASLVMPTLNAGNLLEEVLAGVAKIAESVKLGPGLDPATEMGPLVSSVQQERVLGYIKSGVDEGAEVVAGNSVIDHPGFYVSPTILANVNRDMKVVREEIFGPVLSVAAFKDTEEAIEKANDTTFGLGASVWTKNINKVHRLIPRLQAGMTWVNTHNILDLAVPFGGFKNSGIGCELSEEAVLQHTNIKSTIVNVE